MRDIKPASEQDLIWHWARAEIESERFSQHYASLSPRLQRLIKSDERDGLTHDDWVALKGTVAWARSPLLKGLLRLGTTWHIGTLGFSELPQLQIMNWPPLVALSPSRRFSELVTALDRGRIPPNDANFTVNYHKLRRQFTIENMRGLPVLVSETIYRPYVILEGYSRLSVLTSRYVKGELEDGDTQAVLGVCTRLPEWYLNDDHTSIRLY